jgi:hypothetical protein
MAFLVADGVIKKLLRYRCAGRTQSSEGAVAGAVWLDIGGLFDEPVPWKTGIE